MRIADPGALAMRDVFSPALDRVDHDRIPAIRFLWCRESANRGLDDRRGRFWTVAAWLLAVVPTAAAVQLS